ncbi:MAG: YgdI/YgdR family lipoprotein [Gammaproteobacteria bacterium]|nr:YgdI/YgdR family lipoprotein [Gammaproteobacteria bacterium]MBU1480657.1 YgdI/YgdR family lipoprotein [Gammaproteobacteria bacterium]
MLKRYASLGLLLVLSASLIACSSDQKWKEEVQLSDGKIIVVERELLTEGGGDEWALNRSGTKPKEYRIRFEYPIGSGMTVEWRSTKTSPQTWPEMPLVVDVEGSQPILYSSVFILGGCQVYSKYFWRDSAWIEEKLPPQFEKRTTNLQILNNKEGLPFIDLEHKRKKNSDARAQDYKQVGPKHPYCR